MSAVFQLRKDEGLSVYAALDRRILSEESKALSLGATRRITFRTKYLTEIEIVDKTLIINDEFEKRFPDITKMKDENVYISKMKLNKDLCELFVNY